MENKTYDLKKVVYTSVGVSIILVVMIYLASLTLGRFKSILLEDKGAAWYYWKLPEISIAASDFGSITTNRLTKAFCDAFFNASNSQVFHGFAYQYQL